MEHGFVWFLGPSTIWPSSVAASPFPAVASSAAIAALHRSARCAAASRPGCSSVRHSRPHQRHGAGGAPWIATVGWFMTLLTIYLILFNMEV